MLLLNQGDILQVSAGLSHAAGTIGTKSEDSKPYWHDWNANLLVGVGIGMIVYGLLNKYSPDEKAKLPRSSKQS